MRPAIAGLISEVPSGHQKGRQIEALLHYALDLWLATEAGVLAGNATTVAYSYIGPDITWAVYRSGQDEKTVA